MHAGVEPDNCSIFFPAAYFELVAMSIGVCPDMLVASPGAGNKLAMVQEILEEIGILSTYQECFGCC